VKTRVRQHLSFALPQEQPGLDPPQKDRKSAPLQVPPDEINSRKTRSHEHTTSRNRNRSLIGRSGNSGTSKPSQAKAGPRQSILITQTDTRSKHEFGDASGILSLENCNLVDLALMANFEVLNGASSPTATMTTGRQGEPKEVSSHSKASAAWSDGGYPGRTKSRAFVIS
jgi:hypothetical protein